MPPRIDGVTIIFNVRDIDRTERFYREHLGIDFERYEDGDHGAFLTARIGAQVEVMAFKGDPKPGNTPNVVFSLPDGGIDTVIASFAAAGIESSRLCPRRPAAGSPTFAIPTATSSRSTSRRRFRRPRRKQR